MKIAKLDTLLAFKAIGLTEGLKETERRVACALLDHFNRETWRCDPSLDTIATLLGISRRTVIRSIDVLVNQGYFRKARHGGWFHRNSYEPVWDKFRSIEARWKALRERHRARFSAPKLSPSQGRARHHAGDSAGTQTFSNNLSEGTCQDGSASKRKGTVSSPQQAPQGVRKRPANQVRPMEGARSAAQWRWDKDLLEQCRGRPDVYARVVEAVDIAIAEAATEAELKRRGGGLEHLLNEFERKGLSAITSAITRPDGNS